MFSISFQISCRGSSIKTRIETFTVFIFIIIFYFVAEVVPLKQGLKPIIFIFHIIQRIFVAEVVPLKQGLKPMYCLGGNIYTIRCRGSSIKTRIETSFLADSRRGFKGLQR